MWFRKSKRLDNFEKEYSWFEKFMVWLFPKPKSITRKIIEAKLPEAKIETSTEFSYSELKKLSELHGKEKKKFVKELREKRKG